MVLSTPDLPVLSILAEIALTSHLLRPKFGSEGMLTHFSGKSTPKLGANNLTLIQRFCQHIIDAEVQRFRLEAIIRKAGK
jgi:hypothetical protein